MVYSSDRQYHGRRCDQGCRAAGGRSRRCARVPDKFLNTDLEKILKDKGIKTVIAVGTAAEWRGAVHREPAPRCAALNVIVPVDGMSAVDPFAELCDALARSPLRRGVSAKTTLTKSDMIKF